MARRMYEGTASVNEGAALPSLRRGIARPSAAALAAYLPLMVLTVVVAGCAIRILAAERLTPHVDEAASTLAAHAVVERGVPMLPSGTVYFQGATLSYLLAPFSWLGFGGLDDLVVMRSVSVVAGTIAVYLAYRLGLAVTDDERSGILAALFVAMDPLSVQWSGHVRMYGILQALTLAFVWLMVRALSNPTRGVVAAGVVVFWAAVFTHIEMALLWPAIALMTAVVWRSRSWRVRRRLSLILGTTALAPMSLVALNDLLGSASVNPGGAKQPVLVSFVGDHLIAPLALLFNVHRNFDPESLLRMNNAVWYVPGIAVAAGTLAAAWCWRPRGDAASWRQRKQTLGVATLLCCYWFPVVGVGLFSLAPKERYLLHVHLVGYVLLAAVIVRIGSAGRDSRRSASLTSTSARGLGLGLAGLMVGLLAVGVVWRFAYPVVHADHVTATEYVVAHRAANEPVIVAFPAVAGLLIDDRDAIHFLAGSENESRAERLTRQTDDGLVDYWLGVDAVVSADRLETLLRDNPGAWVVVDRDRLGADWAYKGDIANTLTRWANLVYEADGGSLVFQVPRG